MSSALERVRTGEVTQAVRDAIGECGPITTGDWLALTREGIVAAVGTPADAVCALLGRLVDEESEIVTVLVGSDAPAAETQRIREHIEFSSAHRGGFTTATAVYPYLVRWALRQARSCTDG